MMDPLFISIVGLALLVLMVILCVIRLENVVKDHQGALEQSLELFARINNKAESVKDCLESQLIGRWGTKDQEITDATPLLDLPTMSALLDQLVEDHSKPLDKDAK